MILQTYNITGSLGNKATFFWLLLSGLRRSAYGNKKIEQDISQGLLRLHELTADAVGSQPAFLVPVGALWPLLKSRDFLDHNCSVFLRLLCKITFFDNCFFPWVLYRGFIHLEQWACNYIEIKSCFTAAPGHEQKNCTRL